MFQQVINRRKYPTWLKEFLMMALLIIGISFFHWKGIQPGYTFLPVDLANTNVPWGDSPHVSLQNSLISDPLYQYFPLIETAKSIFQAERTWPLWNPTIFLGHPIYADPLSQPFYPIISVLSLWLNTGRAFSIGLWLQVCVAGLFTYSWLRVSRFKRLPALMGGFTYALSGFLVTWFETTFWVSSLCLFPAILLFIELAIKKKKVAYLSLAALFIGMAFLGGQVQFVPTFLLFVGLYTIGRALDHQRKGEMAWVSIIIYTGVACLLGTLLAAVFLIPFIEFISLSHRFGSANQSLADPLPWQQFITLLIPDYFGNPARNGYWGYASNYSEGTIYVGVVPLFLAALSLLQKKNFMGKVMLLITLLVFYFILGGPGVQLIGRLPGLGFLSLHRSAFILPLLFAWLSAQSLSMETDWVRLAVMVSLFIGLAVATPLFSSQAHQLLDDALIVCAVVVSVALLHYVASVSPRFETAAYSFIVLVVFIDLYLWGNVYNPAGPIADLMPVTPAIAALQQDVAVDEHRIMVLQRNDRIVGGMGNSLAAFNLPVAGGNSSVVYGRYLELATADDSEIDVWWAEKGNIIAYSYPSDQLINLLGITHLVANEPLPYPDIVSEWLVNSCERSLAFGAETDFQHSGIFTPQHSAINRLDAIFAYSGEVASNSLRIQLWQESDPPRLILDEIRTLSAGDSPPETLTFFFAPERNGIDKPYKWVITADGETQVELCTNSDGNAAVSVYGTTWEPFYTGELFVYKRSATYPRAYVAHNVTPVQTPSELRDQLLSKEFDSFGQTLVAEGDFSDTSTDLAYAQTPADIVDYKSGRIVIKTNALHEGVLVLRDLYHPGWQATVDGLPTEVRPVNYIMRGVPIPAGQHEIIFTFRPTSLIIGCIVSFISLIIIVGAALMLKFPR